MRLRDRLDRGAQARFRCRAFESGAQHCERQVILRCPEHEHRAAPALHETYVHKMLTPQLWSCTPSDAAKAVIVTEKKPKASLGGLKVSDEVKINSRAQGEKLVADRREPLWRFSFSSGHAFVRASAQ